MTGPLSYVFYGNLLVVFSNHNELCCWSQNRNIKSAKPVVDPRKRHLVPSKLCCNKDGAGDHGGERSCYLNSVSRSDVLGVILSVGDGACRVTCVIRRFALTVGSS